MELIRSVFYFFRQRIGLVILIGLLLIISVATIKPGFSLLGWDNYSSYFSPVINIPRTFFATWRDYRGLGAPSDAEVTDVFRQVFYWGIHFIVPIELLDQVYYLFALWVGVLSMYVLAKEFLPDFFKTDHLSKKDLFATIAAFFYLFNLNTLSVFYSPIIPFTNRFYSLPLTLYLFLRFLKSKHKARAFLILAITVILTSGSYITPTIVITAFASFFVYVASIWNIKKALLSCFIFLFLNAFWLLPFFNYTIQKSSIVPLARTFVEINESTLNRTPSDFSLQKQSVLYPSFLDLHFPSLTGEEFVIHPLLDDYTKNITHFMLFLFPILYGVGTGLIIWRWKTNRKVLWIPIWILGFLFLSMKEFSPVGFIYTFLKTYIPFFDIVFRISDTKFHAYISLAGSLASAYAVLSILALSRNKFVRQAIRVSICILVLGYSWLFRSYVNGNFIGFFVYAKVPTAYYEITDVINKTSGNGRVLHLPMDKWHSYWRSFSWGYVGSSFFNYFINKPYVDKTFEPASMENAYLHTKITAFIDSFYRATDVNVKKKVAGEFIDLLGTTGVQYILLDESISSSVYARNMLFNTQQYYVQAKDILAYAFDQKIINLVKTYEIPLGPTYAANDALYPVSEIGEFGDKPTDARIDLYQIPSVRPTVQFLPSTLNIDSSVANILETSFVPSKESLVQDPKMPAQFIPFVTQDHTVTSQESSFLVQYKNSNLLPTSYRVSAGISDRNSYMVDVYGKLDGNRLSLTFYHRYYPDINGKKFQKNIGTLEFSLPKQEVGSSTATIVSNWNEYSTSQILDSVRFQLNDVFMPIPANISKNEVRIGSYMLHEENIHASVLSKSRSEPIELSQFSKTDPASCYGTPTKDYQESVVLDGNKKLNLTVQNGSLCVRTPLTLTPNIGGNTGYVELEFEANMPEENSGLAYVCLREGSIDDCLNNHRNIRLQSEKTSYIVPLRSLISPSAVYPLDMGVVNVDGTKKTMTIDSARYAVFAVGEQKQLVFNPTFLDESVELSGSLELSFPKAVSAYSYMHKPATEAFYVPIEACRGDEPVPKSIRFVDNMEVYDMRNCSMHFAQWFHYGPQYPYLMAFEYWLGAGQQPSIVLGRDKDNYFFERASLYQGYPKLMSKNTIHASRFISPLFLSDSAPAATAIHLFQDTAGEGTMGVRNFDIVEYPAAWEEMTITPENAKNSYPVPGKYSSTQLFPSLWEVKGEKLQGMLLLNNGYDVQWGIYDSLESVFFGKSLATSVRCEGFANCFKLPQGKEYEKLFIFYWPERLSSAGWIISLCTVIALCLRFRKKSVNL